MKIICLDDHPTMLDCLVRELNIIVPDAEINAFRDSETALEFAEANGCDVLFCEIDLYGNDGVVLAEMVKELYPRVNIIFTTVCEEAERAKEVFRLHPSGYITKPFNREQLSNELRNLRYPVAGCYAESKIVRESTLRSGASYSHGAVERKVGEFSASPSFARSGAYSAAAVSTPAPAAAPDYVRESGYVPQTCSQPSAEPQPQEEEKPQAQSQTLNAKDLRRLSRAELLEMLIAQTKEHDKTKAELAEAERQLSNKVLKIENAGSIAQAAMQMNGVFEAAQRAADQYLENVRAQSFQMELKEKECAERSERMLAQTRARCSVMESEAAKKCEEMILAAEEETRRRWDELHSKMESYLREHEQLRSLMMGFYK